MRWRFVTWLTIKATDLSDWLLRNRSWPYTMEDYIHMKEESVGHQLYLFMQKNGISFKANLARHDVKHLLLGYSMKMPDELRIHSFLLGNKSNNPMGVIYLVICSAIVPEVLSQLKKDYARGKNAVRIKSVDLEKMITMPLALCQKQLNLI